MSPYPHLYDTYMIYTPEVNIEPKNDGLEDDFPFPGVYSQVPNANVKCVPPRLVSLQPNQASTGMCMMNMDQWDLRLKTGWWLNQPIWKILTKLKIFRKVRGENEKHWRNMKKPAPSSQTTICPFCPPSSIAEWLFIRFTLRCRQTQKIHLLVWAHLLLHRTVPGPLAAVHTGNLWGCFNGP